MSDLQSYLDSAFQKVKLDKSTPVEPQEDYDIYQEIAALIISTRTEAGLTQEQMAQITGVSQANISKFENGYNHPNITTLKKLADGLGKRLIISFADKEGDE